MVILSYAHTRFDASNVGGSTSTRISNHISQPPDVVTQKFKSEVGYVVVLGYGYGQLAWCSAGFNLSTSLYACCRTVDILFKLR